MPTVCIAHTHTHMRDPYETYRRIQEVVKMTWNRPNRVCHSFLSNGLFDLILGFSFFPISAFIRFIRFRVFVHVFEPFFGLIGLINPFCCPSCSESLVRRAYWISLCRSGWMSSPFSFFRWLKPLFPPLELKKSDSGYYWMSFFIALIPPTPLWSSICDGFINFGFCFWLLLCSFWLIADISFCVVSFIGI